ncbi:MAG: DnaB-like helicase C-terminal domain-containing protein [Bacteroidia bacterium]
MSTAQSELLIEKITLSLCLKHPVLLENSLQEIKPRFFNHAENRLIFKAIKGMIELNIPVDDFTLNIQLNQIEDSDLWKDLIAELNLINGNEEDFNSYVLYLKNRHINESFNSISLDLRKEEVSSITKINKAVIQLLELRYMEEKRPVLPLSEIIKTSFLKTGMMDKSDYLSTGFARLDESLEGGLCKGNICVIASRPGMGKTSFLTALMHQYVFKQNKSCFYISLKLNELDFLRYMLVYQSAIPAFKPQFEWTDELKDDLNQIREKEEKQLLGFAYQKNHESEELFSRVFMAANKHKAEILFIDSIQLMHEFGRYNYTTREKQLGMVMMKLKQMAIELNLLIIIGSDLSRNVERRSASCRPMLSDIKDSGWIEEIADQVLFLYRPVYYELAEWEDGSSTYNQAEIIIAKNKLGRTEELKLTYDESLFKFSDLMPEDNHIYIPKERSSEFINPF